MSCTHTLTMVAEKWVEGDSLWVRLHMPPEFLKYVSPKGFVAVDGTSLTVCDVDRAASTFTFMLVAHTQQHVVIPAKAVGDRCNVEVDVLAKMVEQSVAAQRQDQQEHAALQQKLNELAKQVEDLTWRLDSIGDGGGERDSSYTDTALMW